MKKLLLATLVIATATSPAFAHFSPSDQGAFLSGINHPFSGLDHVLVMVAVGLWAATLGGRSMLAVPAAFVAAMSLGFGAAMAGLPLPFVEPVILASVMIVGLLMAVALPVPSAGVAAIVAFFAVFHGYAHGSELLGGSTLDFALGFVLATAMLHAAGMCLGLAAAKLRSPAAVRLAGGAMALTGVVLAMAG